MSSAALLVIIPSAFAVAKVLWFFGIVVWLVVMYTFFPAVVIREDKPSLEMGINGAWLIAAVATQSLAVLGALLATHFTSRTAGIGALFFALHVPARLHALPEHYHADLLSLYLSSA